MSANTAGYRMSSEILRSRIQTAKVILLCVVSAGLGCSVKPILTEAFRLREANQQLSFQYHKRYSEYNELQSESEFRKTPQGAEVTLREAGWLAKGEVALNVRQ